MFGIPASIPVPDQNDDCSPPCWIGFLPGLVLVGGRVGKTNSTAFAKSQNLFGSYAS